MAKTCPIPGCRKDARDSQGVCVRHWFMLPKDMRDYIWATSRSGDAMGNRQGWLDALRWLMKKVKEDADAKQAQQDPVETQTGLF